MTAEWISVDERLPEPGVDVLGLNTFNGMRRAFCVVVYYEDPVEPFGTGLDDWCWHQSEQQGCGRWGRRAFTHWMPLPEPPAAAKRIGGAE